MIQVIELSCFFSLTRSSCGHKAVCRRIASRSLVVSIIHRLMVKMDSLLPRLTKRNLSPSTIKLELMDEPLQLFGISARFEKGKMDAFIDGQLCCFRPRKKPSYTSSVKQSLDESLSSRCHFQGTTDYRRADNQKQLLAGRPPS